ncbi:MAG: hypothetical protein OK422_04325 [Thaumarchaeota archaeon]|nr:hypothetical protein [Nitrososphaerota archaeon]
MPKLTDIKMNPPPNGSLANNNADINYPADFMAPIVSLDDVPVLKVWGARFFTNQLRTLWGIGAPAGIPNRFAFVALMDGVIGEIISSRDALRKSLKNEIRSRGLHAYRHDIFEPLRQANGDDSWLGRVERLRNMGLHGTYIPENIRLGLPSGHVDMRLVSYEHGIIADISLPDDLSLVCERMEDLIRTSRAAIQTAVQQNEQEDARPQMSFGDWWANVGVP